MKIAFIGLGVMGFPMAGHLKTARHEVVVYNRTTKKAQSWSEKFGGHYRDTPQEAAQDADFVISCVGNDNDLRAITMGENGAFWGMKQGAIFIDHSTVSAKVCQELSEKAKSMGIGFMDAPISGGQAGAENGALAIMCGGDVEDFQKSKPILAAYGKSIIHIGKIGDGQKCKMINQIAIAGLLQGLSEALAFSQKSGLDGQKVLTAISGGAAGSWQMNNRGETMLNQEFDFGFAIELMRKDLGIVLDEGEDIGASLEITKLVKSYYDEIQAAGHNRWDTSCLITRLL